MPTIQRGSVTKSGRGYSVRYRDADGRQRRASGFRTPTAARRWLRDKTDEVAAQRRGDVLEQPRPEAPTLNVLCDDFLAQHVADVSTIRTLRERLKRPREQFGSTKIDRIPVAELRAWFAKQPEGYRPLVLRAMRQVFNYAVECKLIEENPAKSVKMPKPKRRERSTFDSWDDVRRLASKLSARFAAVPLLGVATALRPEELFGLQRADIDRGAGVLHVRRVLVDGEIKSVLKTDGSLRDVPLSDAALEALDSIVPDLRSPYLFTTKTGRLVNLDNFRNREWRPAIEAAELHPALTPYSMRHTALSWWISDGLDLKTVASVGGTSMRMLDDHYAHLVPGHEDRTRRAMNARYTESSAAAASE
jgi:integrase